MYRPELTGTGHAADTQLLTRNPSERLGCGPHGRRNLESHPFFRHINWENLAAKKVTPPHKPKLKGAGDLSNFDPEFTSGDTKLTPSNARLIQSINQGVFGGFTYVNQNWGA